MTGTVQIIPGDGEFIVMEWSRGGDSGWQVGVYPYRWLAEIAARHHAHERGFHLHSAEIIPFPKGGAHVSA